MLARSAGSGNRSIPRTIDRVARQPRSPRWRSCPTGGEAVDQLTHALQAGTVAARAEARPALVAATLLHDIGRSPAVAAELRTPPTSTPVPRTAIACWATRSAGWCVHAYSPSEPWWSPSPATPSGCPRCPRAASSGRADRWVAGAVAVPASAARRRRDAPAPLGRRRQGARCARPAAGRTARPRTGREPVTVRGNLSFRAVHS